MSEASCLTICLSHLEGISLPDLALPVAVFQEVDEDRVFFGIRYYIYSSIAQYRAVLRGLMQLSDEANWACANILARHLMEWAAHSSFARLKLASLVRLKSWDKAWVILLKLNGGDLYFRRFGAKYLGREAEGVHIPEPFELANILGVYDSLHASEDGRGAAKEDHSLLSELSHASAACLRQHHEVYENRLVFNTAPDDPSPLPIASVSTIDWLLNIAELSSLVADKTVGPKLASAARQIVEAERQS